MDGVKVYILKVNDEVGGVYQRKESIYLDFQELCPFAKKITPNRWVDGPFTYTIHRAKYVRSKRPGCYYEYRYI